MKDGPLDTLIRALAGLPGLGPRSARRVALHLLTNKDKTMMPLMRALAQAEQSIVTCETCGNLDGASPCRLCRDTARARGTLCVVAGVADLWAVERTGAFKGIYHILGGVLSALDGVGPDQLRIDQLRRRVQDGGIDEIIIALPATVDGQATAHYISDRIAGSTTARITKLAHGVPVGGELDYLDDGTIATALKSRAAI
jgi:recombination protein RecR